MYPSYKAQRPAPPEEFHEAGPILEHVFQLMDLPMLGIPGVEADDLIGTFSTRFLHAGGYVVVVSNDKVTTNHPAATAPFWTWHFCSKDLQDGPEAQAGHNRTVKMIHLL